MSAPAPEFSRVVKIEAALHSKTPLHVEADAGEREALAKRFGLLSIGRLEADYDVKEETGGIFVTGRLLAQVGQACVATGEPVPENVTVNFRLLCAEEDDPLPEGDETELDAEDCDIIAAPGGMADMGEAMAQTLVLNLTPYPRAAGAEDFLREMGVLSEDQGGPLAGLKALLAGKKG